MSIVVKTTTSVVVRALVEACWSRQTVSVVVSVIATDGCYGGKVLTQILRRPKLN